MRILVVEDEKLLCDGIAEDLELEKYTVERCYDGAAAYRLLSEESFDLLILDLNLPGIDGLDLLRTIRSDQPELRVLILSARAEVSDRVAGLDLGADDYLTKPFALAELEARVRSLLRRDFVLQSTTLTAAGVTLDTRTRIISAMEEPLELTPREFAILEHLMLHQDRWVSQEALMEHVLESNANPFSNVVRMHISSLRKKLRKALGCAAGHKLYPTNRRQQSLCRPDGRANERSPHLSSPNDLRRQPCARCGLGASHRGCSRSSTGTKSVSHKEPAGYGNDHGGRTDPNLSSDG